MLTRVQRHLPNIPTPLAGLALAIASLGWCWDSAFQLGSLAKWSAAIVAGVILASLTLKFLRFPKLLWQDLGHPGAGSVVPTLAMGWMVVSHSVGQFHALAGTLLWLMAIVLHLAFLGSFVYHRAKDFELHHMIPSWFVPPVGLIVADVAFPGGALRPLAEAILGFGLIVYALMLPAMMYRLIFSKDVPELAKPTIAILAAPASLSLAGYLTVAEQPSMLLVGLLAGIAVLMTLLIYVAFCHLLRLPFNPGYAAFTFPMVIGATALFKLAQQLQVWGMGAEEIQWVQGLAQLELAVATLVVGYVSVRYLMHYAPKKHSVSAQLQHH